MVPDPVLKEFIGWRPVPGNLPAQGGIAQGRPPRRSEGLHEGDPDPVRDMSGDEPANEATGRRGSEAPPADECARELLDASFSRDAIPWIADVTRFARALARNDADADDITQETFLRAYRYWLSFTPGSDCRRWLFTICRNIFLRKTERDRVVEGVGAHAELEALAAVRLHIVARDAGLDDLFVSVDLGPAILRAIDGLPSVFRTAVQLVDVEGMTYEEVADALGLPVGTVRSRLYRGRRLLQQELIEFARDAGFVSIRDAALTPAQRTPQRGTLR